MNDSTRKTKIAEMAVVLLAAHLGVPAAVISVDIDGIDVFLGRQHVQVKTVSLNNNRRRLPWASVVTSRPAGMGSYATACLTNRHTTKSGASVYGPRSKADLFVFVRLNLDRPFDYEFWVATAAEVAHAKAGVAMREAWALDKRMHLFRGAAA